MRDLSDIFSKRTISYNKFLKYGFTKENDTYVYKKYINSKSFQIFVYISDEKKYSKLIDVENDTDYALVDIEDAVGEFVGNLRQKYNQVLEDIIKKCTEKDVFKCKQAKDVIEYIRKKYGDELEFLWEKFDDNAAIRNKINNKWYAVLLTVSEGKIRECGSNNERRMEIIDLRMDKELVPKKVDGVNIFPGYHMNKKSWITVILDGSVSNKKLFQMIDDSYDLSVN